MPADNKPLISDTPTSTNADLSAGSCSTATDNVVDNIKMGAAGGAIIAAAVPVLVCAPTCDSLMECIAVASDVPLNQVFRMPGSKMFGGLAAIPGAIVGGVIGGISAIVTTPCAVFFKKSVCESPAKEINVNCLEKVWEWPNEPISYSTKPAASKAAAAAPSMRR